MWTQFWDMHSGGETKEQWSQIFIEAPEDEAKIIFYNRFGHNPERVTCTCCGEDYSISEYETLAEATAYHRNCAYDGDGHIEKPRRDYGNTRPLETIESYGNMPNVLYVYAQEILPEERIGDIPEQGYVWID